MFEMGMTQSKISFRATQEAVQLHVSILTIRDLLNNPENSSCWEIFFLGNSSFSKNMMDLEGNSCGSGGIA